MNLLTVHAFVLYIQIIPLIGVFKLSQHLLTQRQGKIRYLFIYNLVLVCFSSIVWILSFYYLLLPNLADWVLVAFEQMWSVAIAVLYFGAAIAMWLMRMVPLNGMYIAVVLTCRSPNGGSGGTE